MVVTGTPSLRSIGAKGSRDNRGRKSYTAVYRVVTDDAQDQAAVVMDYFKNAGNQPYINSPYTFANDNDADAFCVNIEPEKVDNSQFAWDVTFTYETPEGEEDDKQQNKDSNGNLTDDPTRWMEKIDVGYTTIMVPVESAVYLEGMTGQSANVMEAGKVTPIINSAFDPMEPPPEEEVHISVVRRSFYGTSFSQDFANLYIGMVNNAFFGGLRLGYAFSWFPYTALIVDIGGGNELINGRVYWHNRVEVHVNPLGWRRQFADRGMNRAVRAGDANGYGSTYSESDFVTGRSKKVPVVDAYDNPVRNPVLLDGNGQPLGQNLPTVFLKYATKREGQFPQELMGLG